MLHTKTMARNEYIGRTPSFYTSSIMYSCSSPDDQLLVTLT